MRTVIKLPNADTPKRWPDGVQPQVWRSPVASPGWRPPETAPPDWTLVQKEPTNG